MSGRQRLPGGFDEVPVGPALSALLASIDLSRLYGGDLYRVLAAQARQVSFEQARLLAVILEAARTPGVGDTLQRRAELDEFSADQIGFELTWSRHHARSQLTLARRLIEELPQVYAALRAGHIDAAKAGAFADLFPDLDVEQARRIAEKVLAQAGRLSLTTLRERLRYHVKRANPDAARRQYQHSVADRRVWANPASDGTVDLGASHLPPDRAAAALDRLDRLARAAKAAGDPRTLAQLGADAYLDLLAGRPFQPFQRQPDHDPVTAAADAQAAADGTRTEHPLPRPIPVPAGAAAGDNADNDAPIGVAVLADNPADPGVTVPADSRFGTGNPDPAPAAGRPEEDGRRCCTCDRIQPAPRRGNTDIFVELTTLMCLNDNPALIPGWGPVIADIARQVAHDQQTNPAWRYHVTDRDGNLLHHGPIRRRPTATETAHVQARDIFCKAPGCRRRAIRCDTDHQTAYATGGPSHRANLCTLCRHHHRLRHEHGFVAHRVHVNTIVWDAPNRRIYTVLPDATLILTAQDVDPPPPPGYVAAIFGDDYDHDLDPELDTYHPALPPPF